MLHPEYGSLHDGAAGEGVRRSALSGVTRGPVSARAVFNRGKNMAGQIPAAFDVWKFA